MRLLRFKAIAEYIPGKFMAVADALSRSPLNPLPFRTGQERILRWWLAYAPPAGPDTLASAVTESALRVSCSPSLLSVKSWVLCFSVLCGRVFVSKKVWEL